ncbi:LysE family translocator [Streptomyces nodosus]|uniref:Lysine transporter LysE n=1 Tax=Streptomyces nodosus TaxID=40318 RepID=A0A0B5DCG6_9ACTN|nr:LysE family translocator [Streptomyces nodosus]AJE38910.1 lysine transporter LysE [Streptomyces nodosus]MBB4789723.1 threonine/homoserine/homoserine lactone efflux protein [Streptomyces nodosus]
MLGIGHFWAFLAVVAVLIAVPGPSVVFVVGRGVALGRRAALATAVGNNGGVLIQAVLVAFGLGTVVAQSIVVFSVLKLAGALYLVHLGVQTWRHRGKLAVTDVQQRPPANVRRIVRQGFVVGVSNPKGFLIFSAVLPQFVNRSAGQVTLQLLILGIVCAAVALVSDSAWGLLAGTARGWFRGSPRRLSAIGTASGAVMVGLGVRLALTGNEV